MFRVTNPNRVQYYTIVVDNNQVKENKSDAPHMILKPRAKTIKKFSRQYENFVLDRSTGEWHSELVRY